MVLGAFNQYGYNVSYMQIPRDPRRRSGFPLWLQDKLGHGSEANDGTLALSGGGGQWMHWAEIANAVINVQCDVLTILNCCHAGAAMRYRMPSRPNYEGFIKGVMMAVPEHKITRWGYAAGFAACLEQALRDRRTNWEEGFEGRPSQWVWAINRIMQRKPFPCGPVAVRHLIAPPPRRVHDYPIVVSPRR
ncbi:hypothetical protein O1611_g1580 [Lasiodiplodia mahajangana]|uniref:Uncharacterized protein n=1 Tax=Lasiodiplodia mahajangana TaxID=1108764 RepID=A0ACC2JX86_9PEZI|nr:hypothetical protein O1611_g1580 [Lasiodiplodia mahajangana]